MEENKVKIAPYPAWVLTHRTKGREIKRINGKYYVYGVKSIYDKTLKRAKKISLGILGRITEENGFIASSKTSCDTKKPETKLLSVEYGFSKWLIDTLKQEKILEALQVHFPSNWEFIVWMVYCRIAYQSPLKNIVFYLEDASILDILGYKENIYEQKISDLLFDLGCQEKSIHQFMQPQDDLKRTVLVDATEIILSANNITLSQRGYNANMDFEPQFVLLYLYDATSLQPLYYRLLSGNIREVSALENTIKLSGIKNCVYIADKGFFRNIMSKRLKNYISSTSCL